MNFKVKNLKIDVDEFDGMRIFLREYLDKFYENKITHSEFVAAVESCFDEGSPLSWENTVILRVEE